MYRNILKESSRKHEVFFFERDYRGNLLIFDESGRLRILSSPFNVAHNQNPERKEDPFTESIYESAANMDP